MKLISDKDLKALSQRLVSKINNMLVDELPIMLLEFDDSVSADIEDIDEVSLGLEDNIRDIILEELNNLPETKEE